MPDNEQQRQLLERVLDGLDDLYDQRFGWPPHLNGGPQTVEMWLIRLLVSTASALEGSEWEIQLRSVAAKLGELLRSGASREAINDAALEATAELRDAVADAV